MNKLYKIFILLIFCLFLFGFKNVDEKYTINPNYIIYEGMSDDEKSKLSIIPEKYVRYYETDSKSLFSNGKDASFGALPTSFDLRNYNGKNYLTDIKNQGTLGLCWAFSSNSALESNLLIHGGSKYNFSENQPDYVANKLGDSTEFGSANSLLNVAKYWFHGYTPVNESVFGSYFTTYKTKSNSVIFGHDNVPVTIDDAIFFDSIDILSTLKNYSISTAKTLVNDYTQAIKNHIMNNGAVATGIYWDFYNESKNIVFNNGSKGYSEYSLSGHAVTIIGWNDNYDAGIKYNGNSLKGAWLAMNSWGDLYSYFYISYYDIDYSQALLGVINSSVKDWDNAYLTPVGETNNYTSNSVIYGFYLGESAEKLDSIKLFYPYDEAPTLNIKVSDGENTYTVKRTEPINIGITSYDFGDVTLNSDTIMVTVEGDPFGFWDIGVFTDSSNEEETVILYEDESNNFNNKVGDQYNLHMITKNIDSFSDYTVKVEDTYGSDITNYFTITKEDLVSGYSKINMKLKSVINSTTMKVIVTCNGASDSVIYRISSNASGYGTEESPYIISEAYDLLSMENSGAYFVLGNDIDMSVLTKANEGILYNDGNGWTPINFYGDFNGNGYKISGLYSKEGGLFADIADASIYNLELEDFDINTEYSAGILAATSVFNTIDKITVRTSDIVSSNHAGGLFAEVLDSDITNIKFEDVYVKGTIGSGYLASLLTVSSEEKNYNYIFVDNPNLSSNTNYLLNTVTYIYDETMDFRPIINLKNNKTYVTNTYSMIKSTIYQLYKNGEFVKNVSSLPQNGKIDTTGSAKITKTQRNSSSTFNSYDTNVWVFVSNKSMNIKNHYTTSTTNITLNVSGMTIKDSYLIYDPTSKTINSKTFKNKITKVNNLTYKILLKNGILVKDDNAYIATGNLLEVCNQTTCKQYTIIILGDTNKDGEISISDVMQVSTHNINQSSGKGTLITDAFSLIAADANQSGDISISDVMKISSINLGRN